MTVYFKATRPDGTDFYTGRIDYAAAVDGPPITLPVSDHYQVCTGAVLHASDAAAETLVGGSWPCRLFEVTGEPVAQQGHKYGFRSLTVVREVDAWLALGPNGAAVAAVIDRAWRLSSAEVYAARGAAWGAARDADWAAARYAARYAVWYAVWDAARHAARHAARDAARDAARHAARDAAWDAVWDAARDAALATVVADLIGTHGYTQTHHDTLMAPWRQLVGVD